MKNINKKISDKEYILAIDASYEKEKEVVKNLIELNKFYKKSLKFAKEDLKRDLQSSCKIRQEHSIHMLKNDIEVTEDLQQFFNTNIKNYEEDKKAMNK